MKKVKLDRKGDRAPSNGVGGPEPSSTAREARFQQGKELRKACQRSTHGEFILSQRNRDPLALLEDSNEDRLKELLPLRFTRMMESPFAFFRGTAVLQAYDLQGTPSAGIKVQCCGDCHLMNFGEFATPERVLVFDINDFDETLVAPFEWDIKRLATSFVLAARWLSFSKGDARRAAEQSASAYRTAMAENAQRSTLEVWYARIAVNDLLEQAAHDPKALSQIQKSVKKAQQSDSEHVFQKLTTEVNGKVRIVEQPPLLFHSSKAEENLAVHLKPFLAAYRETLLADRQALFDRFTPLDGAYKVVGVGSVGTRCMIVLFEGQNGDHLFLQVKEARKSVLEGRAGSSPYANNGERVVTGQRMMQAASDLFLGWTRGPENRDFYVRQLRDMKVAPNLVGLTPRMLEAYATLCGRGLARAHAKASGEAATISGYLGNNESFDDAIGRYAQGYADQVEQDYESFRVAARAGRFPLETMPSEMEAAVR